ncbi:hypothetical protein [Dyadobacter chenhuakuii]|uniref:hypothetical protein n=1 Tax=Dyadobacter chenhuakuii TaxID=2909339 RepID=UPI0035B5ECC0
MPEIRLCGKWLLDAGFKCGDEVTVRCFGNKLGLPIIWSRSRNLCWIRNGGLRAGWFFLRVCYFSYFSEPGTVGYSRHPLSHSPLRIAAFTPRLFPYVC